MKAQKIIQQAARFGPLIVLLLLCLLFTVRSVSEFHPQSPADGTQLARDVVKQYGTQANVIVLAGYGDDNQRFAEAVQAELHAQGVGESATRMFTGIPLKIRGFLDALPADFSPVTVVATNRRTAEAKLLAPERLHARGGAFAETAVAMPESYSWPAFLTVDNFRNLLNNSAQVAIVAVGMTLVILAAGIDLSVGSVMALAGVMTAVSINSWFGGPEATVWGLIGGCLVGVGVGAVCGVFNGLVTTFLRVPPFIVTLAMFMIARGLAYVIVSGFGHGGAQGETKAATEVVMIGAKTFGQLAEGRTLGVPNPILIALGLYLLAHFVMSQTSFGRYVYAVGGNREAARLSGVPVYGVLIVVYALCGAAAGLSGIVDASRFGGRPAAGELYELQAIAAVVVGGTSIAGGEGRVLGTLIGTLIIAVIETGLNQDPDVGPYELKVVFGGLILLTVVLDQLKNRYALSSV